MLLKHGDTLIEVVPPPWYRFYPVELTEADRAMLAEFGVTDEETLVAIEQLRRDFAETFASKATG